MSEIGLSEFLPGLRNYREDLMERASYFWDYLVTETKANRSYNGVIEFETGEARKIILKGVNLTFTVSNRIVFHDKLPLSLTDISFELDKKIISALKVYHDIEGQVFLDEITESGFVDTDRKNLYREFFDKLIRNISSIGYLS